MEEVENKPESYGELTFEEALEKLELIVQRLEKGQISLDESLETFEQGMKLAGFCSQKLAKAERKVEQLIEENGKLRTIPFEENEWGME